MGAPVTRRGGKGIFNPVLDFSKPDRCILDGCNYLEDNLQDSIADSLMTRSPPIPECTNKNCLKLMPYEADRRHFGEVNHKNYLQT